MDKSLGLGKGLSALMGDDFTTQDTATENNGITLINIDLLVPSPFQPRRVFNDSALSDLVHSIREKGVLQPLLVRKKENGLYEVIAGERRLRASRQAGLSQLPVIIKDFDDKAALEVALIENLQREDLNPLEEAEAYKRLLDEYNYTQDELSRVVGKSRSHVANMMRLLDLPEKIKQMIEKKELTIGHARALLNAQNATDLAEEVITKGLSVRQTEKLATSKGGVKHKVKSVEAPQKDADIIALEREMSNLLKTQVNINWNGHGGTVVVAYQNLDMLDVILQKLTAIGSITTN